MLVKRKHLVACAAVVLISLILGFFAVHQYFRQLRLDVRDQLEQNLLDTAQQNVEQIQAAIDSRVKFVKSLSSQMSGETDPVSLIDRFTPLLDIHAASGALPA